MKTSLAEIRSFTPCLSGWKGILRGQHKTEADKVLFQLVDCLESNTISDVLWLLGKLGLSHIVVSFARKCADSVDHLKNKNASASAYAAYASVYASAAAAASVYASAAAASADAYRTAARKMQIEKNKQFLISCINDFERNIK